MRWLVYDWDGRKLGTVYAPNGSSADRKARQQYPSMGYIEEI